MSPWLRAQFTARKSLFYLCFHGLHVAIFILGWWIQASNRRLAPLNRLHFSIWFSRGAGLCLSVDLLLVLLPMCRNLIRILRPKLRFVPLDENTYFHRQVAYSLLFWTIVHVSAHYVNFFNIERLQLRPKAAIQIHYMSAAGITGHVMLLCMLLIYTTSHAKVRQQSFEAFWYTHHLFIPFFLAAYTHATGCFVRDSPEPYGPFEDGFWAHCLGYQGWRWELVAGMLYLGERIYREIRARQPTKITQVIRHPHDAVEIKFTKPSLRYKPGQWVFINVPSVSKTQWHPFTITSCPIDPYISIHIRPVGDFTRALASALGAGEEQKAFYEELDPNGMYEVTPAAGETFPALRIDGPYGAPAEDVFNNEVAVLIGTGIGVTPWASILKNIWHMRLAPGNTTPRLRRVEFIWVCRNRYSFEWLQALLSSLEEQSLALTGDSGEHGETEFLRIHTYLTEKMNADAAQGVVMDSVGATRDPLTELSSRTNFGRPNFERLLTGMSEGILNQTYIPGLARGKETRVGVYFCGPNSAARDIKAACIRASSEKVRFRFWKEHF
ncbi:hypothetical protein K470DRAFT_273235 [Piedraia hortae CBS 480.64]|uniref:FAD-binding FR-type domain-containing protein n=1 Tax=Piedraia hortae CBS 480.64 TaxID=1314780 RepID=A0A6A7BRX1_9PEZI|nr:hypothetical protein K470DRAFT_273235 [Piedraia hortae CBS 480.64]